MKKDWKKALFWVLMFIGAFIILTQMGYSDGDDAFFYSYSHSMGFFEYLNWRYQTWVGRITAEAMVYLTFNMGLWFWRVVNALMLVLLPMGIITLSKKAAGTEKKGLSADLAGMGTLEISAASVAGYLLMSAMTVGYAAVWVNGSIFYTWSFTCGIWSLVPIADYVFDTGDFSAKKLFYSIPCAILATMSIEQMGAVLLAFQGIGLVCLLWKKRRVPVGILLQLLATFFAFLVLFSAPGNELRVAAEVVNWMPQYDTLTFGEHFFITAQWLLSSFANENRLFLAGIWLIGIWLIWQKKEKTKADAVWGFLAVVFLIGALLPYIGVTALSDLGMHITDITVGVQQVPTAAELTGGNIVAIGWWVAALLFTFFYLWRVSRFQITVLLAYLAGIASEAILFFSPTMYASGARVYYLTDLLYLFVILTLSLRIKGKRARQIFYVTFVLLGVINFIFQIPVFVEQLL